MKFGGHTQHLNMFPLRFAKWDNEIKKIKLSVLHSHYLEFLQNIRKPFKLAQKFIMKANKEMLKWL